MGSNISTQNQTLIPVDDSLQASNHPNRFGEETLSMSDTWFQFEKPLFTFDEGVTHTQFCNSGNGSEVHLQQASVKLGSSLENDQRRVFNVNGGSKLIQQEDQQNQIEPYFPDWLKLQYSKYGKYVPKERIPQSGTTYIGLKQEDGLFYSGEEKDGIKHGYGYLLIENKFYEGHFVDGQFQGWGRILTKDTLQAGFWNGEFLDIEMTLITKDYWYYGECKKTQPHGKGEMENDKHIYKGDFHTGQMHGKGEICFKDNSSRYVGEFLNDVIHGFGIYYFPSNKIYEGMFQRGKFHGQGEMKWPNGKYYKGISGNKLGQFVNGMKQGYGEFTDENGSVYKGQFSKDKKNGNGVYTLNGITIQGNWKDDDYQDE